MAEFTPGPWVFDSVDTPFRLAYGECIGGEDTGVREVYAEDCEIPLATCYPFSGIDNTANARPIAAAPDLYTALQAFMDCESVQALSGWYRECPLCCGRERDEVEHEDWCPYVLAKAALAKAKGEE